MLISSSPIPKYFDKVLTREQLRSLAELHNSGAYTLNSDHDIDKTWGARVVAARFVPDQDGIDLVLVDIEVEETEWNERAEQALSRGGYFGLSCVLTESIADFGSGDTALSVFADPYYYQDAVITGAAEDLSVIGKVVANRYFQFAVSGPMKVVFDVAWATLIATPPNILAAFLVNAIHNRFRRRDSDQNLPVVDVYITDMKHGRRVKRSLKSYTEESAQAVIEAFFASALSDDEDLNGE